MVITLKFNILWLFCEGFELLKNEVIFFLKCASNLLEGKNRKGKKNHSECFI